jgi:hypothetical protein
MNSTDFRTTRTLTPLARPRLYWTFADALVLAKRHLIQIPRIPEELVFSSVTCLVEPLRSRAPLMSIT